MLRFNIPDTPYVLSLDDLPLDLLSQHLLMPSEEKRPLWSVPHEDSIYYQMALVAEEESDEEASIEPYKTYLCHICNVDVPEKYYKQHNNSQRHQTHKKLAGKLLANVAKQIDIDINTSDNYEYDEFYCEICCKAVAVKHKRKHKKSRYHLKSIENTQLASNFLEMYISNKGPEGDGETDNNCKSEVDSECTSVLDTSVIDDGTDNDIKSTDSTYNDYLAQFVTDNVPSATTSNSNDNVQKCLAHKENNEFTGFQIYLKNIIEKYNLPGNIPIMKDNLIVVVTPKGYREYISMDNFHGYARNSDFVFCLLCRMWVQNDIEGHEQSQQHAILLMRPVNDKFARILDERYSHCLLCNVRVLTASNHTAVSLKHKKYTEQASASSTYHEEPTTSTAIPLSEAGPSKVKRVPKIIAYKKQFSYLDESHLKCLICSVRVASTKINIIRHVEGSRHRKMCDVLLQKNNIRRLSFDLYHCNVCNEKIHDFINHNNICIGK